MAPLPTSVHKPGMAIPIDNTEPAGGSDRAKAPSTAAPVASRHSRRRRLEWLPIPVLLFAIASLWVADLPTAYDLPRLRTALNFATRTLGSLFAMYLAGRIFLMTGAIGPLLLGCGVTIWGSTSLVATTFLTENPNLGVTISNLGAWLSALCHLAGVLLSLRSKRTLHSVGLWLGASYVLALGVVGLITLATLSGWLPIFFVPGQGGTLVRQVVLGSAIAMFLLAVFLLWQNNRSSPTFAYWYALALLLIAVGLCGLMISSRLNSALDWTCRTAQYLGGIYMIIATLSARRASGRHEIVPMGTIDPARHWPGVAIAIVLAAAACRLAFMQSLGTGVPFLTFYAAVVLAGLYGGLRAGVLAAFLSALMVDLFWIKPQDFAIGAPGQWLALVAFLVSCTMIAGITEAMRRAQARATEAEATARIVAERAQVDRTLRESGERLKLVLQASSMGTFEVDLTTGEGRWNDTEFELLGLKPGDKPPGPQTFFRFVHPEDVAPLQAQWQEALRSGNLDTQFRIIRADGEMRWLAARGQFVFENGAGAKNPRANDPPRAFLGVNFDITERKRVEELLARSLNRFDGVISAAMDAIISIDGQQRILLFNPAAEKMFGVPGQDAMGKSINQFIPARFRAGHAGHVENFGKTGVSTRHMGGLSAVSGLRADGEEFPIEASISQVEVSGEQLFTVILRDITERKRAQEELRASREQLRALAARIQAAREEERTHVAREIHDVLAQELTSLKIDLAWLDRRLAEPIDPTKREVLQTKVSAMMDLTDQASQSVQRIATELRPVVLDSLGLCAATKWIAAEFQKRTTIHCRASVSSPDLALDRDRSTALFRILQESLTNVSRHAQATTVEIHLWQEVDDVILTVVDNGRGVQPSELNDPHSLGLLGMRERASLLDGQCAIWAPTGGGTTVEVRIPAASVGVPAQSL
jgi:PAS domain S-box-containing protein